MDANLDDILKSTLKDLKNIDNIDNSQFNLDDILQDTQKIVNDAVKNKTIEELNTNEEEKIIEYRNKPNEPSTPGLKINTSTETSVVEEDEIPSKYLSNPIDFVNYIEYQLPKEKTKIKKNTFILKKFENEQKPKFSISELNPQEELSLLIMRGDADITSSMAQEDNFITGDIYGEIKFYSLKDKKLTRTLPCPLKKRSQVNAIDLSDDGDYCFAGFDNGNIVVYELLTNKCKLINNSLHKTACINLKFIERIDKNNFRLFSSDSEGNVYNVIIKNGIFGFSTSKTEIFFQNKNYPTFLIHLLRFKENEIKNRNYLKKIGKTLVLGNLEKINLYSLEPKVNNIFSFERPLFIKDFSIPDIAIGLGKPPSSNEFNDGDDVELQLLLLISWDKVIYLFVVTILDKDLTPLLMGHYVNDNQIIRIGFLNLSTVYLIDKKGNYKILNTRKFNLGDVKSKQDFLVPIIPENNNRAELQETLKFDGNILKQMNLRTPNGGIKETYLFTLVNNYTKDELNVLTSKNLYNQQLLDYQKYLKDLQKKENWMELLILGINIYQGNMTALNGIPLKIKERKKIIGEYLQDLISQFLFTNAGSQQILNNNKNNYFDPSLENARIEKNMEITIEFCIEIDSVDYLLDKILKIYESKKYKDIFLSKLEPFILCNKMIKFEIPEDIILDLIKIYESKKKFNTLSQLLLHINVKSLDIPSVKQKIENLFLTTPLIYICVNGSSQDYFEPVLRIYEKFISSSEIPDFVSYENLLKSKKISLKEIKASKQYLGHKLFWYIKKSLTGKKFPNYNENMDREMYHKAISKITYWLLSNEVLTNLLYFETQTYFDIFTYIFLNEELIEVLEDNNDIDEKKKEALEILKKSENNTYSFVNINPSDLVNHLINEGNKLGTKSPIVFLYLCIFIITVGKKMNLKKDDKREAAKFIIENHYKFGKIKLDLPKITKNIINIIDDLEFTLNDYNDILSIMATHSFDEVRLFIYKKNGYFKECLELYLNEESELKDKRETLFPFINMTLTKLKLKKGQDQQVFAEFKSTVMKNLIRLGEINVNELHSLINTWYTKEKKEVINKLSDKPEIQLIYVEILVKKIISNLKENEGILVDEDQDWVEAILKLHLKLLCYLNKKEKILPWLKECPLYPVKDALDLCLRCHVYDAIIYLYQKAGDIDKALNTCLQLLVNDYNKLFEILCAKDFNENSYELNKIDFETKYNNAVEILEENEKALSEDHNMWFTLLDYIYKFVDAFPQQKPHIPKERTKYGDEIENLISDKLKQLLEKMSSYVGITKILEIVSEKNKKAEFKEFKPLLLKMLASFGNQTHLLHCVREYLIHTCLEDQNYLQKLNIRGKDIDFKDCDVCLRNFNQTLQNREKVVIFECNHIEHEYCSLKGDSNYGAEKVCPICLQKEIDDSITCSPDDPRSSLSFNDFIKNDKSGFVRSNSRAQTNLNLFKYNKGLHKMKSIDNYNIEKRNMFYYDSANSCRNKYRKVVFGD